MSETATPAIPFARTLRLGDHGPDVIAVKRALVKWDKGNPDGVAITQTLGAQAVALLRRFQQAEGLHVDGIYGPATQTKLAPFFDAYGISLIEQELQLYRNPYRDVIGLAFAGYDQGVDFSGSGHVYAVGPAQITGATEHSGWPGGGAVSYRLSAGKGSGKTIYFAENITPLVIVGQHVTSATPIATMHNAYPYTESGWAQDGTDNPMSQPIAHSPTHFGINYGDLMISLGEARCPRLTGGQDTPLPAGWPTWL